MVSKSLTTNLVALALIGASYLSPKYSEIMYLTGLFALSGGITNWLAIHMLFEKVPFFYGSGVVPTRFEEFKLGIKRLVMNEFFTPQNIDIFMKQQVEVFSGDINKLIDFDRVFDGLVDAIEGSSMGSMFAMVGGRKALKPLRQPITLKLQDIMKELQQAEATKSDDKNLTSSLLNQVEKIIDQRLDGLTPEQVKNIIQDMMRKHLGWLVVWGGAVGGLIGFGVAII
jgi:uncharacterized membrane protein YheB (UPF0754 family)